MHPSGMKRSGGRGGGERHDGEEMREQEKSEMEGNKGSEEERERGEREVGGGFNPGGSTESHTLAVMGRGARWGGRSVWYDPGSAATTRVCAVSTLSPVAHKYWSACFCNPPRTPGPAPLEPPDLRENHAETGRTCKLHTESSQKSQMATFRLLRVLGT